MIVRVHLRVQRLQRVTFSRAALANALPQTSNLPTKKQHRRCVVVVVAACMCGHACVFLIDIAGSVIERVKLQGPPAQGSLFALGCVAFCSFWRENVPPADFVARSSRSAPTFRLSTEVAHASVFPPFLSRRNSFPFTSMLAATLPFFPLHTRAALFRQRQGRCVQAQGQGQLPRWLQGQVCCVCVGVRVLVLAPRGLRRAVCGVAAALSLHLLFFFERSFDFVLLFFISRAAAHAVRRGGFRGAPRGRGRGH